MNEDKTARSINTGGILPGEGDREVPCDGKAFFESFYDSTVDGEPQDRDTIGGSVTEPESRFHYNVVENALILAMARIEPLPPPVAIRAWSELRRRADRSLLDIGSGTGHWIDFFRDTFFVTRSIAVEITDNMSAYLNKKYADNAGVQVVSADVAAADFYASVPYPEFDYISAIGVMFHITDDDRWEAALGNLSKLLASDGIMFVGGEFGEETRNVHFNKVDEFEDWREFRSAEGSAGEVRVNKRVRSLIQWKEAVQHCGLDVVEVLRTPKDPAIAMPENDLLVLRKV